MKNLITFILTFSILAGQLIKLPVANNSGPTFLDFSVISLIFFGLIKLKFKLKKPPKYILAGWTFITIASLSLLTTPLHLNKFEYVIAFSYSLRFCAFILLGWVIYSGGLKLSLEKILTFSGVGLAILGLIQFILFPNLGFLENQGWDPHFFRTVSTFLDPNFAGAFFVLTIISFLSLRGVVGGTLKRDWQSILLFTIVYLALLTTFSRSSYLMFLVSGVIYSLLKKSKFLFLSTLILFLGLLLGFQIYTQMVAKPRNIDREQSASFRLNTWQQGLTIFEKSPIFGIGFNAYRYAVREFNIADDQFLQSRGSTSNDSSLLFVLATTGVLGFASYVVFLFSLVQSRRVVLLPAIGGLIIHSLFSNSLFYPFILFWVILAASSFKDDTNHLKA